MPGQNKISRIFLLSEEMITFKCDTRTDDDPGFGTAKIPEMIPKTAKQDLPAPVS